MIPNDQSFPLSKSTTPLPYWFSQKSVIYISVVPYILHRLIVNTWLYPSGSIKQQLST